MRRRADHWTVAIEWLLIGATCLLLLLHAAGWVATAVVFWRQGTFFVPRLQSAMAIGLGLIVLRAASSTRRMRRVVISTALIVAAVMFFVAPLPKQFEDRAIMPSGTGTASSRQQFGVRFDAEHQIRFHSHLGDVAMTLLDRAFGRSDTSPGRAYDSLSRLAGLLFLMELFIVAAWHRWSPHVCRYIGLALATPLVLLYFGYWELGYLSVAVGVVPLLARARASRAVEDNAATQVAGMLQGFHTAFHGFGMVALAGGALASLAGRAGLMRRTLRATGFTASAVALYLGWIFFYVAVAGISITWSRQLGYRPLFESMIFDKRIANPLLSLAGFAEFGLFSALAGVPLLALAVVRSNRRVLVPAVLYALPGLVFLIRWWPVSAPFNLDLLLAAFPGVFAACWVLSNSRRNALGAFGILVVIHALLWTTLGSGTFDRVWIDAAL